MHRAIKNDSLVLLQGGGRAAFFAAMVALVLCALCLIPGQAFASSNVDTAYNRSVKAVNSYNHADGTFNTLHATYATNSKGCTVVSVDVSDLGLSKAQKQQVMDRLYYNTDYWYIDACGNDKFTSTKLVYTCLYKDSEIPDMKKKLAAKVSKALSYIEGCSTSYQKVHMLHDWIIDNVDYGAGTMEEKMAYGCIVNGKADCMGFAYGMDYLLRAAGFTTTFALNTEADHIWNMVYFGGNWYHVDTTWANTYTGKYFWTDCRCHRWLLLTDSAMNQDEHAGFYVVKNGKKTTTIKATDDTYDRFGKADWNAKCPISVGVGGKIIRDGYVFVVTVKNQAVKLAETRFKTKSSYTVPSHIWYRGHDYRVSRVGIKAFENCTKATNITIGSNVKAISRYAFKGCTSLKTITVKSSLLTKDGVTNSLLGSYISTIKLSGSKVVALKSKYKSYFAKSNSGRSVTVVAA